MTPADRRKYVAQTLRTNEQAISAVLQHHQEAFDFTQFSATIDALATLRRIAIELTQDDNT
jgi:uncharacterized protein (DUF305 family)